MRVDPDDAAGTTHGRHADERAERDRVVAAEHERRLSFAPRLGDQSCHPVTELEDLRQVPCLVVTLHRRLGDRRLDVSKI